MQFTRAGLEALHSTQPDFIRKIEKPEDRDFVLAYMQSANPIELSQVLANQTELTANSIPKILQRIIKDENDFGEMELIRTQYLLRRDISKNEAISQDYLTRVYGANKAQVPASLESKLNQAQLDQLLYEGCLQHLASLKSKLAMALIWRLRGLSHPTIENLLGTTRHKLGQKYQNLKNWMQRSNLDRIYIALVDKEITALKANPELIEIKILRRLFPEKYNLRQEIKVAPSDENHALSLLNFVTAKANPDNYYTAAYLTNCTISEITKLYGTDRDSVVNGIKSVLSTYKTETHLDPSAKLPKAIATENWHQLSKAEKIFVLAYFRNENIKNTMSANPGYFTEETNAYAGFRNGMNKLGHTDLNIIKELRNQYLDDSIVIGSNQFKKLLIEKVFDLNQEEIPHLISQDVYFTSLANHSFEALDEVFGKTTTGIRAAYLTTVKGVPPLKAAEIHSVNKGNLTTNASIFKKRFQKLLPRLRAEIKKSMKIPIEEDALSQIFNQNPIKEDILLLLNSSQERQDFEQYCDTNQIKTEREIYVYALSVWYQNGGKIS
ncbi:MAG: hypothetical protein HOA17_04695 [Candidatus Melainabacteria bacterium]|nr:hypothetical protein [Candidatus Melainabacteria bacterium]